MSGDRHPWLLPLDFQAAVQGQSNANDLLHNPRHSGPQSLNSSSSVSTAPHNVSSTANSHMTGTDGSAHSVEMNIDAFDQVLLRINSEETTNSRTLCCRRNVRPELLRSYSTKLIEDGLYERIDNEDCLVIHVSSTVKPKPLILMIKTIGEESRIMPPRNSHGGEITFSDFFDLCVVLWSYVCKIDHWVPMAEYVQELYWKDDLKQWPPGRLTQWLFIGLVFNWRHIFEAASSALIVDFSKLDEELHEADYLPDKVIRAMTNARRDYMEKTYDEVVSIHKFLTCRTKLLSLPRDIHDELAEAPPHLDYCERLPEDFHRSVSPGKVLQVVSETIGKAQSVPPTPSPMSYSTDSTTQTSTTPSVHSDRRRLTQQQLTANSKTPRSAEGGEVLFDVARDAWRKLAKKRRTGGKSSSQIAPEHVGPAPLITQEIDNICQDLLDRLKQFRTSQLLPLNIDGFSRLRDQHLLLA